MASNSAILRVQVLVDAAKAAAGMDKAAGLGASLEKGLRRAALPAAAVVAGVAAIGRQAGEAASDVEQAMGGIDAVFGASAGQVKAWSDQAAASAGLAKSEYGDLATLIGSQLKNAGTPMDQLAGKTNELIKLGADLSATYGGTTADAVSALSSALKGEMDPLERYGTSLNQAAIQAQMAADGTDKLTGEAGKAAKANATLALITKQTADAHGKFASEADTAAGQQARATAAYENAQASLGKALLPAMTAAAGAAASLAGWLGDNADVVGPLVAVVAGLAAAILAANVVMSAWSTVVKVATAVQWLWNAALDANPIGLVVLAVAALVAAVVLLWRKSQRFRAFVLGMWDAIKAAALAVARAISGAWSRLWGALKTAAGSVRDFFARVWTAIKNGAGAAVDWIRARWAAARDWLAGVADRIKAAFGRVWDAIKRDGRRALDLLLAPARLLEDAFDAVVSAVRSVVDWISKIHFPSPPKWLSKLPGVGSLAAATPGPAALAGVGLTSSGAAAGGGVTINLYGVLDGPDAARKVRAVLRDDDRRRAGIRTSGSRAVVVTP